MDEEITIINEKTRNEKIKNFFLENKKKIIYVILISLLMIFSFLGYGEFKDAKKKKISNLYNLSIIEYKATNKEKTFNNLKEIVLEKDPTYSPLSLYFIIDNDLIEDKNKINDLFDILINKTSLEEEIKNLIIYKKALFNADEITEIIIIIFFVLFTKKLIIFSFLVFLFIIAVSSSIIKSCFLKHIGVFLHFYNILAHFLYQFCKVS